MKILIFLLFIIFFYAGTSAQHLKDSEVPAPVKEKFSNMYPNITAVEWEMEHGRFEAEFKENKTETSVIFEKNGTYIQQEVEIHVSSLPSKVNDYASEKLPGKKIKEGSKITDASGKISYEAEIGGHDYIFDEEGNFIRDESDSDDTEDNK
jgi:hypothetical protein